MKPYKAYILTLLVNLIPLAIISIQERDATGDGKMGIVIYCLFYIISAILNISFFFANAKINNWILRRSLIYYLSTIFFFVIGSFFIVPQLIDIRFSLNEIGHLGKIALYGYVYFFSNFLVGIYFERSRKPISKGAGMRLWLMRIFNPPL